MPDEDKIILTLGRKSFDMSMFVKKVGFKVVDGTDYLKYEALLDSDRDITYYQVHRTGQGSEVAARLGLSTAPLPTFLTSLTSSSSTLPP